MDSRGEIGALDEQIRLLTQREKLPEEDIKALCEKVRMLFTALVVNVLVWRMY